MQQLSLFDTAHHAPAPPKAAQIIVEDLKKQYYSITEVADMFHVNASLLRFWEKEFPTQLGSLKKNKKGDRFYTKKEIEKVKTIFYLVKEKRMTLEGAREYLKNYKRKAKDDKDIMENLKSIRGFLVQMKKGLN